MLNRRQFVAGVASMPGVGLSAVPVNWEATRILVLANALLALTLSAEHRKWAETIRSLAAQIPASADVCRGTLSPIMAYSEYLGLHHRADSPVGLLTKEITAAVVRMDVPGFLS